MKLSKRLEAVATLVDIGKRVIDVGCDHAYLDIYLTLNNDNKCIATDINKNALEQAKKNIKKYNLEDKIETKLTNGLTDIKVKDNLNNVVEIVSDYIVIKANNSPTSKEKIKGQLSKLNDTTTNIEITLNLEKNYQIHENLYIEFLDLIYKPLL